MTINTDDVQFYSGLDTIKNFDGADGSISVPVQSYTAGQYRSFSTTINLDRELAMTQILTNFSTSASRYYYGGFVNITYAGNFTAQMRYSKKGKVLTATCFIVNNGGSTTNNTALTVGISVDRFVAPIA